MKPIKRLFSIFTIFCMLFALTGCDSNTFGGRDVEISESISLSPASGGTIGIYSYKPDTLCPIFTEVAANQQMLNLVFDGLIEIGDSMEAQPCLAESWYSSNGGREWTISLRQDVLWHDGSGFTADDVVFTINQIRMRGEGPYTENVKNISTVAADGAYTVKITLTKPSSNFINMLYFPIVKSSSSGIDKTTYTPVGTGAFTFHDENEGNLYRLRRNDEWWNGKAYLSEIDVHLLPEKSSETYMFSSGEIDIAGADAAAEYKTSEDGGGETASNVKSLAYDTSDYTFLGINHKNSTLEIETVRQAISYVVPRADIVNEVLDGAGIAANAPINPSWSVCDNDIERYVDYNEQKAEALLTENGWIRSDGVYQKSENGIRYRLEFSLLVNRDNAERTQIAEDIANTLTEFGIKINVIKREYDSYASAVENGNYDLFIGSYRITPDLDLSLILGSGNVFGFEDEEILELLSEIKQAEHSDFKELYGELQNLFNKRMPIVGLYFEKGAVVTGSRVKGKLSPNMYNIYNGIENIYVEETSS